MKKIALVVGTRPEAIKMAPLFKRLQSSASLEPHFILTGQHRDLVADILKLFKIKPTANFALMRGAQTPAQVIERSLPRLTEVFRKLSPAAVLVHGDTATTLAASLAAYFEKLPVGHVEAGLRTHDRYAPFPEEINRHLADVLATYYFAPTEAARKNLLQENVPASAVLVTGNTVIDAFQWVLQKTVRFQAASLRRQQASQRPRVMITAHRRESFGTPLVQMYAAFLKLARAFPDHDFIYPVHPNPQVKKSAHAALHGVRNLLLTKPLSYLEFAHLLQGARLILTDSGGVQEEAAAAHVPLLVLRNKTERPEAVESGTAKLVGTQTEAIVEVAARLLRDTAAHRRMADAVNPFGDGRAAERISNFLQERL